MRTSVSLDDKYDLDTHDVYLSGTQALVRLVLAQRERDRAAGHRTAGFVTGYRGSPLGGLDQQFGRAKKVLGDDILFQPALNEDLGATALWGTQRTALNGENAYDGVFGVWYGKGPGVDRSGDAFRHANLAGTAPLGGVLALMGDDHTCESSTTAHQSEFGMVNALIPVLSPSGVQDIVDFGLLGFAMSRYAGLWVGLKCVKDTVESTASIDGRIDRLAIAAPDFAMPAEGVHIRVGFDALGEEARLHGVKLPAAKAFATANRLNRVMVRGGPNAKIGIVGTGKSWLDVLEALHALGLDEVACADLGIRLFKVGMPWPMPAEDVRAFADGLDEIIVVEEKRGLIEPQMKDILYGTANAPRIIGKSDENGAPLFREAGALDANHVATEIGKRLLARGATRLQGPLREVEALARRLVATTSIVERKPYFCAGCPHSSSTVVPSGARAAAGIGCHFMALWMDRSTEGFTQMGGEGAQWIGEAPFSTRKHLFQNIGDGTYNHSGSLAIRAAHAAGVNITYKILFNDAVAMTGGQAHDGGLTVPDIAAQMRAEGARQVVVVSDEPEKYGVSDLPHGVAAEHRDEVIAVQQRLSEIPGVTVMIYDQTCASEKRRRRKRGAFPDPDKRIVVNERVCEGCGDCGVQSNCVAIQPVETAFGRKRQIDQSTCNKDFSCLKGFCPSFVTVNGAVLKKADVPQAPDDLPEPARAALTEAKGILVTGVGGTGVVTVGAVIGMAAHLEGLGAGIIDMAGLAQKGGAVLSHIKIAPRREDVTTIRVGPGGASAVLGCDIAVAGSAKVLSALAPGAVVIANTHEQLPGEFTRNIDFSLPTRRILQALDERADTVAFDATGAAVALFGDAIAANMMVMGAAYQSGALPLSSASLEEAIRLNGAAVPMNLAAFRLGRLSIADPERFGAMLNEAAAAPMPHRVLPETLDERIARYAESLTAYQNADYARRFQLRVGSVRAAAEIAGLDGEPLVGTVADALYRLMAVKDEYEVARLFTDGGFADQLKHQFASYRSLTFHMAPPIATNIDAKTGRPAKRTFGPWMLRVLPILARMKRLRGGPLDIFGKTAERRRERQMLADYEATVDHLVATLTVERQAAAEALAAWPDVVKGYGPVRAANMDRADKAREALTAAYDAVGSTTLIAAE
ncbi:indolepyruvate ferredoxin oxidoreductase family protein [Acuticoccus mangrovi]|uniref:Indolepyruvate ferredoxin oxidoreductase family protein n=1 Tax=Acuticoccus mangrovi TaxID=2796142 RepID=A0A934MBK0_9HYPH|nr:indolepyruvate ferredoxin oxidoreductase family protein [Acuticoccus mangrovi]MBJ3774207.1 indolepyruvate ferredoxin oxidoreductase family protein [Acuticoccus mangrovi]